MKEFSQKVVLGRTGLSVSRIGIGSSYGVSERACRMAFDAGVNYFFWGSVRTPQMGLAIRDIARSRREDLVVVLQCYVRNPRLAQWSIERGLRTLGIDQADILLLGWCQDPPSPRLLDRLEQVRGKGRFRFLGISSHKRPLFQEFLRDGRYDVFHVRYSAAHRGAEQEIFPYLPGTGAPGVASFTNTRWGDLLKPKNMPSGTAPLSAPDCYRFVLSSPHVHVAICGPKSDAEMEDALTVLSSGPLDAQELDRMRVIGDHVHGISSFMSTFT
jgi:aryl-alcohol dehydrogenase-like predicted oxidoreductase